MDCIDAATSGTLSPHILPVMDLQKMLLHISDTLPPTLYLPVSPDDTLLFTDIYALMFYLKTNSFTAD